jgi:hypothetical protein
MKKITIFLILTILSIIYSCMGSPEPIDRGRVVKKMSADWSFFMVDGSYKVVNNVWNKGRIKKYSQTIYLFDENGAPVIGWDWVWPFGSNVVAYPEIVIGEKPWDPYSGNIADFPFSVGSKNISVDYDIDISASGVYNIAFSLWATSDNPGTASGVRNEIMIWILTNGIGTWGTYIGTLNADGTDFKTYVNKNHGDASGNFSNKWTYTAFIASKKKFTGPLHIGVFLDFLLEKEILTEDLFINGLELGTEIVRGKGSIAIRHFNVLIEPY